MYQAGVPCRNGSNYLSYIGHGAAFESIEKALKSRDMVDLNAKGFGVGSDLNGKGHPEGLKYFWGIPNEERSDYIRLGQTMLMEKIRNGDFNAQCLYSLPGMIQLRKIRAIIGNNTFSTGNSERRDDSIGVSGDFRKAGKRYELSLGIIYNADFPNLLAAGRIVSAEGDGWEITRVIPTAALTGQAAGIAASLIVKENRTAGTLEAGAVQKILDAKGVKLHF